MKGVLRIAGIVCLCAGCALFGAWLNSRQGTARLSWQKPEVRKSVHTFAYKAYADPHLSEGRFFLSKIVFKNEGDRPVTDFSLSYQIPGYVQLTTADTLPQIPPGVTVVKLFYPQFSPDVTRMRERTKATLEVKLQWKENGQTREDVLREDFTFRGVNEIEYTDIPAEERIVWQDLFINADLLSAMVTPNDPVVAAYASEITAHLEGAVAGAGGGKEAKEFLKGTYDYMVETGLQYAGTKGVPEEIGDVSTIVQTVRLPRDQIRNNNGLCIELALLWASLMEHVGIRSCVVIIPGHAFVRAPDYNINNRPFTVECTAITPKAVHRDRYVTFDDAVKMSQDDYAKHAESGTLIEVDIRKLQGAGIVPPELPDVDLEKLKTLLASRKRIASAPAPAPVTAATQIQLVNVQASIGSGNASPQSTPLAANASSAEVVVKAPVESAREAPLDPTAPLGAFALVKEGNRVVGEQSKDAIVQIRSEKSVGSLTPSVWFLVYYDPDATFKATEVKFISGKRASVTRPMRVLELGSSNSRPLDSAKLKWDSDRTLATINGQPALKGINLKATQFWLQRNGSLPVWRVRLWAAKHHNPNDTPDIGDIYVSTDDGTVVRSDLHLERLN